MYVKGRDYALFMGIRLKEFNDIGQFPTFTLYVDSFKETWAYGHKNLQDFIDEIKALASSQERKLWSVERMIEIFEDQLMLLKVVRQTVELLKTTNLYKVEKGTAPVEKEHGIHIGQITGKVNIHSVDNSTNITNDPSVFLYLRDAIINSDIEKTAKNRLLQDIESMKRSKWNSEIY